MEIMEMPRYSFEGTGHTLFQIDWERDRIRALWTCGTELGINFGPWRGFVDSDPGKEWKVTVLQPEAPDEM